uniref:Uncharacterized protein n=1 Tax=Sander lucioperca TaxID=283035 RepID=A0A8D0A561_SANLU
MNVCALLLCVLLSASSCSADKAGVTLQPWLVGLTAVVGFLFIVFTILIVHRLLRKKRKYNKTFVGLIIINCPSHVYGPFSQPYNLWSFGCNVPLLQPSVATRGIQ